MTERTTLAAIQLTMKCEHTKILGEPCDENCGGWWTCGCQVMCDKANRIDGELTIPKE